MSLVHKLNVLHASYVDAINAAVAEDDYVRVDQLAEGYDAEAVQMIAEHENKTYLLPISRTQVTDTPLRLLARRLRIGLAA